MKKIIIPVIGIIIILLLGIGIWLYKEDQENKRIDAEALTLKENLTIEFGEKVKASDFIQNLNGTILEDKEIDTEKLGEIPISFEFKNIKNKIRKAEFTIKTVDTTAPKIFIGGSYTVKVGYNKRLTDALISGDDIDDNPTREVIGEYDVNTVGDYNLTYVVTDSSGNQTKKDFVLHVKEKVDNQTADNTKRTELADVIKNHKTDKTKIGIDVSKWQKEIDWQQVKEDGIEFVMMRIGYQTEYDGEYKLDPCFKEHIEGAQSVGLPVGVYFYSYVRNVEQAKNQAEWIKENLKDYEIELPIAFDWETWSSFNKAGMSFYNINKVANAFLDNLAEDGYKGMLYSSKNYLEKVWYPTEHETWLAHYTSKTNYEGKYSMWQMCDNGRVKGINEKVDIDIMYLEED